MFKTKAVPVSPDADACRQALIAAIKPYADNLGGPGILAVASALVGQLIAMQDQRTVTPAMAIEIVVRNIKSANQEVLDGLLKAPATRA